MTRRVATAHTETESLFERMEGRAGVARLVDRFYARLWSDEVLAPWLAEVDPATLKPAQIGFFVEALGGGAYTETEAGPRLDLEQAPLLRAALHLYDAVMSLGLPDHVADEVLLAILTHALRP
jgi:truncated hemoglobin YjbI